jgi:hypothetical protein
MLQARMARLDRCFEAIVQDVAADGSLDTLPVDSDEVRIGRIGR